MLVWVITTHCSIFSNYVTNMKVLFLSMPSQINAITIIKPVVILTLSKLLVELSVLSNKNKIFLTPINLKLTIYRRKPHGIMDEVVMDFFLPDSTTALPMQLEVYT